MTIKQYDQQMVAINTAQMLPNVPREYGDHVRKMTLRERLKIYWFQCQHTPEASHTKLELTWRKLQMTNSIHPNKRDKYQESCTSISIDYSVKLR